MYETFITKISLYRFHRVCYSSVACQLHSVTRCRNGCMTKCFFKITKQQETRPDVMIYVSLLREQIYFILDTINFDVVSD